MRVAALVKTPLKPAGVSRLARAVLEAERADVVALSFTFVGPRRMRLLNRTHLGHDYATDVIAFALAATGNRQPATGTGTANRQPNATGLNSVPASRLPRRLPVGGSRFPVLGDIYVCPAAAAVNAKRHGATLRDELRRLVIHGTLHVLGYQHDDGADRISGPMWRRQERYLTRFGRLAR